MKNMLKVCALVLLCSTQLNSQNITSKNIPTKVKSEFAKKYPAATNVKWEKENKTTNEAIFKLNKESVSANFTSDGKWLETEEEINASQLPKAVQNVLNKKYPKANYTELAKVETPENGSYLDIDLTYHKKKFVIQMKPTGEIIKTEEVKGND